MAVPVRPPTCSRVRGPADLTESLTRQAGLLLADLVAGGAALGWVEPPTADEVAALLHDLAESAAAGDAALTVAVDGDALLGLGWWRRYARPTYRRNADLQRLAVARGAQRRGIGRALTAALVAEARAAGLEQLTLDLRGDNDAALGLYRSLGFVEYGRLHGFVAVGDSRYDTVLCVLDLR